MWWLLPAATALLSANKANRQAEQQQKYNIGQSEMTRYSPWTGQAGKIDNSYTPSVLEGGLSGGVQGLGIMQSFGKSPWGAPTQMQQNSNALGEQQQSSPWSGNDMKPNIYQSSGRNWRTS